MNNEGRKLRTGYLLKFFAHKLELCAFYVDINVNVEKCTLQHTWHSLALLALFLLIYEIFTNDTDIRGITNYGLSSKLSCELYK